MTAGTDPEPSVHEKPAVTASHAPSERAASEPTATATARPWLHRAGHLLAILASAALLGLYASGGPAWPIGFVALLPWLLALDRTRTLSGTLISAVLMAVAFALAVFGWFAAAFGAYVGLSLLPALLILAALGPILQAQVLAFALARHLTGRRHGSLLAALAGAAAWVGCEWLLPKLLGDTLGHGLLPSPTLRQMADLGGAASLSLVLLLVNDALAGAVRRWRAGPRALLAPITLAAALVAAMAGYGHWRLSALHTQLAEPSESIRIGLIQSNITHYERLREEMGAYEVIRHVLDTHYTLSDYAVREQGAEALLWSETVYPTTFGSPKSAVGADLDREIQGFVDTVGVPLVFGTYDLDTHGEYNSAAFVQPQQGLIGHYRKTHPFPLTEYVPAWIDGPLLRDWLPWLGNWRAGSGARVLPLRTADGRQVDVLPLICLDDVRTSLALDGTRLGANAILGLSNDAWFTEHPEGARLHLAVAAFRSIETRLPQLRVTSNGLSAIIDESGEVVARTEMGQQAVLVGEIPVRPPVATLMVRWGDWLGPTSLVLLLLLALHATGQRLTGLLPGPRHPPGPAADFRAEVVLLRPVWRLLAAALRLAAGAGLAWLLLRMLLWDGLQVNALIQLQLFGFTVVAPALAAWAIRWTFKAQARIEADLLVLEQRTRRIEIPIREIERLHTWRIPVPISGVDLRFVSGRRWNHGIALADPIALHRALAQAGSPVSWASPGDRSRAEQAELRAATRRPWLDHPLSKFLLFPLVPALPAFRLHQVIAFGGTFGEYHTYGPTAWLSGLLIWWTAWAIGLMLFAAGLRILIEAGTLAAWLAGPQQALTTRNRLEWLARLAFYLGVPTWLAVRVLAG